MTDMTAVPIERDRDLARLVAPVEESHERITITRDGEPVAVLIDAAELAGLEETVELLNDPEEAAALDEGIADVEAGRVVDGPEVLARFRARRG